MGYNAHKLRALWRINEPAWTDQNIFFFRLASDKK